VRIEAKILLIVSLLISFEMHAFCADYSGSDTEGIETIVASIINPSKSWRIAANERIDQIRKADMSILVDDQQTGLPVQDAEVSILLVRHRFRFGGGVDSVRLNGADSLVSAQLYKETYLNMGFNTGGFGNALKPKITGLHKYLPNSLAWFEEHGISVRGHTIFRAGYDNLSAFVRNAYDRYLSNPTEQNRQNLADTIEVELRGWASRWNVINWGVLNEPRGKHEIMDVLGNEAMIGWFRFVQESKVDPNAVLYLNENRIISDPAEGIMTDKIRIYMDTVDYLLNNNAPLTGLGLQSRFASMLSADTIYQRLQLFEAYGLPIEATEFEMKWDIETELDRAIMTERVMTVYFSHPLVRMIYCATVFPNRRHPEYGREMVDIRGNPKLRGKIWLYLTKLHWTTKKTLFADELGRVSLRAFKGDYVVSVRAPGRAAQLFDLSLDDDTSFVINLAEHSRRR
jgi:hypothetical protein